MLKSFYKEHKWLSYVFILSVFLILKNSSIPYIGKMPIFITMIFDAPQSDFGRELAKVVDIFSTAYTTSLIFYYCIEYIPAQNKKKSAEGIIKPQLIIIYMYIAELVSILDYSNNKSSSDNLEEEDSLDIIRIENENIYCHRLLYEDGKETNNIACTYNVLNDCDKYRNLIMDRCKDITSVTIFGYCDERLIQMVSEIQLAEIFRILPRSNDMFAKLGKNIIYHGIDEGFTKLKKLHEKLGLIIGRNIYYKLSDITEDEVKGYCKNFGEAIKQYPDLMNFLNHGMDEKMEATNE